MYHRRMRKNPDKSIVILEPSFIVTREMCSDETWRTSVLLGIVSACLEGQGGATIMASAIHLPLCGAQASQPWRKEGVEDSSFSSQWPIR